MDNREKIIGLVAAAYIIYRVFTGIKRLGVFEKIKETGLFMTKEASKTAVKPTLTEIFRDSQTRYHVELIMYVLMLVLAILVILHVLPWGIAMVLTIIFEVIISLNKNGKNKDE